ncbi:type I-E CRISPR-associated protein Cse2/CasB [Streptomyces sp. ACT015]|uniref:type I-E CRISPR-associated protein Cse2/CasB n=1 Tax=Streptomyces sp. ACT015 TaxID=3134807 RepID=UPI003D186F1C
MTTTAAAKAVRTRVADLTALRISVWQKGYLMDRSADVAALARLRRGAGRDAAQMPDLWGLVDPQPLHFSVDGQRPLSEREVVRGESALYTALTLWALHQQSRGTPMHRRHTSEKPGGLGATVRRLMAPDKIDEPVRKRLVRAGTAPDIVALGQRLREIVALLRREDIPLDYALLAGQLYAWQWPGGGDGVRLEWGRSFSSRPSVNLSADDTAAPPAGTGPDLKDAS